MDWCQKERAPTLVSLPKRSPALEHDGLESGGPSASERSYRRAHAPRSLPQKSAQPVFARSAAPYQPYGFPQESSPYSNVHVAPHVLQDMRMMSSSPSPSPSPSLVPVAMPSAASTSSYRAQDTVVRRGVLEMRWGISLAIVGALLGGVFGVTMQNAKRDAARASAAQVQAAHALALAPAAPAPVAPAAIARVAPVALAPVAPAPVAPAAPAPVAPAASAPKAVAAPSIAPGVVATSAVVTAASPSAPSTAFAAAAVAPGAQAAGAVPTSAQAGPLVHARASTSQAGASRSPQAKLAQAPKAPVPAARRGNQRLDLATKVPTAAPPDKAEKGTFVDALRLKSDAQKDLSNTLGGTN